MTQRAPLGKRWKQSPDETSTFSRGWRRQFGLACVCAVLSVAGWTATATAIEAQQPPTPLQRASRNDLNARVEAIQRNLSAGNLKDKDRTRLQAEAAALKLRLSEGDFHPGDRFLITIIQDASTRPDTATVRDSLLVSIIGLPDLSLQGTLRSELNEKLTAHVARFLRNSSVRSIVFTRVAILGGVLRPGYYAVPPDQPIGDLLMVAGGTAPEARLNELQVNRGSATLISVKDSRKALREGRTLEQLDVQSGDEIKIPLKRKVNAQTVVQLLLVASSILFGLVNFLSFYYSRQQP